MKDNQALRMRLNVREFETHGWLLPQLSYESLGTAEDALVDVALPDAEGPRRVQVRSIRAQNLLVGYCARLVEDGELSSELSQAGDATGDRQLAYGRHHLGCER